MKKGFPSAGRLSEGPRDGSFKARLNRSFTARQGFGGRWRWAVFGALLLLALANGCAMQPPTNTNGLTGPRLVVTMTVQGSQALGGLGINPAYYYFFVINYSVKPPNQSQSTPAGNKGAPGPIAVFQPTGGPNGFVASSDGSTNGYTDYVEFSSTVANGSGYGLFHFVHNNPSNPQEVLPQFYSQPAQYTPFTQGDTILHFTIYLTQLVQDYNREHGINQSQADTLAQAQGIKYLQVNFIATNTTSLSPATKETDALGNGPNSNYLNLDLTSLGNGGEIDNTKAQSIAPQVYEPPGDVYTYPNGTIGGGDPSLDLVNWSIQYLTQ